MRSILISAIAASVLITIGSAAQAQGNGGPPRQVQLNIQAKDGTSGGQVRITFLSGPDSLLGAVRTESLPVDFRLSALSLKLRIESLEASRVMSVQVRLVQGSALIKETSLTGAGGIVTVDQGSVSVSRLAPR